MGSTREVQDRPAPKKHEGSATSSEIIEFFGEMPVNMEIFHIKTPSTWGMFVKTAIYNKI